MNSAFNSLLGLSGWSLVISFLVVAVLRFVAPLVGYTAAGKRPFGAAIWLLFGVLTLSSLLSVLIALEVISMDNSSHVQTFLRAVAVIRESFWIVGIYFFIVDLLSLERSSKA